MIHYIRIPSIYVLLTRGRGVLPMMAYTGRPRPKGVPFFRLQVYERVGISLLDVYKRVGKSANR